MAGERKVRSEEEIINRMIELADKSYNCSQIMMILALDQEDKKNTDLIRAMSGLADGFVKSPISALRYIHRHCGVR